jgi:hypothetical protein
MLHDNECIAGMSVARSSRARRGKVLAAAT